MIGRVYAIALNTFREAVRDRVLHGMLGLAAFLLLLTLALGQLSLHEERRVVEDIGLASISLLTIAVAVFLGSSLLHKEIERKTLYVILPRPLARAEFVVGKYLGIAVTGVVFIAIMGAVQLWVMAIQAGASLGAAAGGPLVALGVLAVALARARDRTAVALPWALVALVIGELTLRSTGTPSAPILGALTLIVGELLVVAAIALFFSSFSTPFLTGAFSIGVWLVGRSADEMATMRSTALPDEVKVLLRALAHVVPNYHLFVPGRRALHETLAGHGGPWLYVGETMLYATLYAALGLTLAALVFHRRDFE